MKKQLIVLALLVLVVFTSTTTITDFTQNAKDGTPIELTASAEFDHFYSIDLTQLQNDEYGTLYIQAIGGKKPDGSASDDKSIIYLSGKYFEKTCKNTVNTQPQYTLQQFCEESSSDPLYSSNYIIQLDKKTTNDPNLLYFNIFYYQPTDATKVYQKVTLLAKFVNHQPISEVTNSFDLDYTSLPQLPKYFKFDLETPKLTLQNIKFSVPIGNVEVYFGNNIMYGVDCPFLQGCKQPFPTNNNHLFGFDSSTTTASTYAIVHNTAQPLFLAIYPPVDKKDGTVVPTTFTVTITVSDDYATLTCPANFQTIAHQNFYYSCVRKYSKNLNMYNNIDNKYNDHLINPGMKWYRMQPKLNTKYDYGNFMLICQPYEEGSDSCKIYVTGTCLKRLRPACNQIAVFADKTNYCMTNSGTDSTAQMVIELDGDASENCSIYIGIELTITSDHARGMFNFQYLPVETISQFSEFYPQMTDLKIPYVDNKIEGGKTFNFQRYFAYQPAKFTPQTVIVSSDKNIDSIYYCKLLKIPSECNCIYPNKEFHCDTFTTYYTPSETLIHHFEITIEDPSNLYYFGVYPKSGAQEIKMSFTPRQHQCPSQSYLDTKNNVCLACPEGCFECNESDCLSCTTNGYKLVHNKCIKTYEKCNSLQFFNYVTEKCESCDKVSSQSNCQNCISLVNIALEHQNTYCLDCSAKFILSQENICVNKESAMVTHCQTLDENCLSCGAGICKICKKGYYVKDSKCSQLGTIPSNCNIYKNDNEKAECLQCKDGYAIDSDSKQCVKIKCDGVKNCQTCASTNVCMKCVDGYNLNDSYACDDQTKWSNMLGLSILSLLIFLNLF